MQRRFEQALDDGAYSSAWRYACRLCNTREDAEDLLQDSLARACQSYGQLRVPDSFRGWLLSIVRNCHLMQLRTQHRRIQPVPDYPAVTAAGAGVSDPFAEEVLDALAGLNAVERELLTLFYIEGLSMAEVAQVTGLRAGPLRQRMLRARRALKQRVINRHDTTGNHLPGGGESWPTGMTTTI